MFLVLFVCRPKDAALKFNDRVALVVAFGELDGFDANLTDVKGFNVKALLIKKVVFVFDKAPLG